jgi:ketosteroid isomerase-like protein
MLGNEKIIRELYAAAEGRGLDTKKWSPCSRRKDTCWTFLPARSFRGQAIGDSIAGLATAFPDVHRELLSLYVAENVVVVEHAIQGTHKGELVLASGSLAPTGKAINVPCSDVFHLEGGKVTSFHCYNMPSVMLQQLGVEIG